jgi:hypothetical protein
MGVRIPLDTQGIFMALSSATRLLVCVRARGSASPGCPGFAIIGEDFKFSILNNILSRKSFKKSKKNGGFYINTTRFIFFAYIPTCLTPCNSLKGKLLLEDFIPPPKGLFPWYVFRPALCILSIKK